MLGDSLSTGARVTILVVAFLGWFFGGVQIGMTNLIYDAVVALLAESGQTEGLGEQARNDLAFKWFAFNQCAFLFGAAAGGYIFGKIGDRLGRARTLGISILWFSILTACAYLAQDPDQLLIIRFLACLGVGGCWPNGVALVSEAWAKVARPVMASLIGMAGNLGIFAFATLAAAVAKNPSMADNFRWVFLVGASAAPLGLIILLFVKESPTWVAARQHDRASGSESAEPPISVFRKPYLGVTLVGIALATVPLFGGWSCFAWLIPWAGEIGTPDLKAHILQTRSVMSIVGSGLAAVIALKVGRRTCYFVASLAALGISQYIFWFTMPTDDGFLIWVALWGFFNGVYFGWLPFFLPELFETKVRATGAGVSFNYGRILTATTIFLTPYLKGISEGNHAQVGRVASLVFLLGMVAILFAPDTSKRDMEK